MTRGVRPYWARPAVRCTVLPLAANTVCSARNPSPFVDVTRTPCSPVAPGKLRPTSSVDCPCGGSVTCCTIRPLLPYSVTTTRTVAADGLASSRTSRWPRRVAPPGKLQREATPLRPTTALPTVRSPFGDPPYSDRSTTRGWSLVSTSAVPRVGPVLGSVIWARRAPP